MKLEVLSYNQILDFHNCKDEQGNLHRVNFSFAYDILVKDGTERADFYQQLVGKTVDVGYLQVYEEIAHSVTIMGEK